MASISINELFVALENQIGQEALLSAFAAYSKAVPLPASPVAQGATVPPVPGAPVKARKPQSEETKAAAAAKRAATKAAKAIAAAAPAADAEPVAEPVAVPAAVVADEKPKKVLSEEQKAKMKAGREAAKAKKEAEKAAAPAPVAEAPAPAEDGNASDTSSQKRRGPKKLSEMSAEERAAHDKKVAERKAAKAAAPAAAPAPAAVLLPASPAPAEESHTVFAPFTFKGVNYLRNKRGDLLTEEYEWVGRYDSAKKAIDTKFAKPADLEDE